MTHLLDKLTSQSFITIVIEITALVAAVTALVKYLDKRKKERRMSFVRPLSKKLEVNVLLDELQEKFKDRRVIPSIADISNDGSRLKADTPAYIRVLFSTNTEALELWGKKTLIGGTFLKPINDVIAIGYSSLDIDKFHLKKVEYWAGAKHIEKVFYFYIGSKKKKSYLLAINSETKMPFTDEENLIAQTYAVKIKNAFNDNKYFWQHKIK